ncbi:MAG: hypothetical protein WD431_06200 [Cyclobacteriaceae bacterium]
MNSSSNLFFQLQLTPGAQGVYLRSLCGADEIGIEDSDTHNLIGLLDSLMHSGTSGNKIHAAQIVTAERDRILALLYISIYGEKIASTILCSACGQKFDLDFSLRELLNHYQPTVSVSDNGKFQLEPGISFRLPNGEDELGIQGLSGEEAEKQLFERCLLDGNFDTDNEKVQLKMAELAPVLSMEMQAVCPECSHTQQMQFDMQSFFLTKLKQERPLLIREIHHIASRYGWSQHEILNLPRNLRKQYAALIQSEN